jgi:hypothetical protein
VQGAHVSSASGDVSASNYRIAELLSQQSHI